jgi:hypothetical protein
MTAPVGKQPLRLVGIMFDEAMKLTQFSKGVSGIDIRRISTSLNYYRASSIEEMDRNMVFLEFNSIRNAGEMIFVTDSIPHITLALTRAVSEKWVIPTFDFQLGYYPNLRAEVSRGNYFLLDKFKFTDAVVTRVWTHQKIYADDQDLSDIVHVTFKDSWVKDYGDTERPIR